MRLRSPFRHCCVLPTIQKCFWLPSSYPVRQRSLHSSFSHPFSGPVRPHLGLCSEPCPPARLSSSCSQPPGSSQSLTDTSCSHCLPLAISFPSLISKSASPTPLPLSVSFFLLSALTDHFLGLLCQSWAPKPPLLPPYLPPHPPSSFAGSPAIPQTTCPYLVTSCPLHFNQLSPTY